MTGLASSILLVIEFICGVASGVALGRRVPSFSLARAADGLIGGPGGLIFVWPAAHIPGDGRFIGQAGNATMQGAGGLTPDILIGAGIVGLLGGTVLTL